MLLVLVKDPKVKRDLKADGWEQIEEWYGVLGADGSLARPASGSTLSEEACADLAERLGMVEMFDRKSLEIDDDEVEAIRTERAWFALAAEFGGCKVLDLAVVH